MHDPLEQWLSGPRSLSDELFSRPDTLKVFISSQMRGGVLAVERVAAANAVESIPSLARAWYWERDADAGPYCSESVCIGQAATSDGLILILGESLTPVTRKEYEVAFERGVATYIFLDQRQTPNEEAQAFIEAQQRHSVTKGFANVSELHTHIIDALLRFAVSAVRQANFAAGERRASRRRERAA